MNMQEFTPTEKGLIYGMRQFHLTPEEAFWIFEVLETEENRRKMLHYLAGHLQATKNEIIEEVDRITGR